MAIFTLVLVVFPTIANGQNPDDCGVEDTEPAVYIDFLDEIQTGGVTASGFTYFIPVNFVVFDETGDGDPAVENASLERSLDAIDYLNNHVDPAMKFYLCDHQIYYDTEYSDDPLNNQALSDFVTNGIPIYENPDAVNVYVSNVPITKSVLGNFAK